MPKTQLNVRVDEATAEAIRRAYDKGGELSGIVEFRQHFPLITDNAKAGLCVDHRRVAAVAGPAAPGSEAWRQKPWTTQRMTAERFAP